MITYEPSARFVGATTRSRVFGSNDIPAADFEGLMGGRLILGAETGGGASSQGEPEAIPSRRT